MSMKCFISNLLLLASGGFAMPAEEAPEKVQVTTSSIQNLQARQKSRSLPARP